MKRNILLAIYFAAIIGAISGIVETSILILKGNNVINRHHFLWIMSFYAFIWAIGGLILGILTFLISRWKKLHITSENLSIFYISATVFFTLFVIGGLYFNFDRYYIKQLYTIKSLFLNLAFTIVILLLSFLSYKILAYYKAKKFLDTFSGKFGSKKIKVIIPLSLFLIIAIISLYPSSTQEFKNVRSSEKPPLNIIFILIDALRVDHLSCYGYPKVTTPNIDQIASEGVLFTNAYANSSWTKPTTATIFSSLYLSSHNVHKVSTGLSDKAVLLPELLKKKGYSTAIFSSNSFVAPLYGFDQGVDFFYTFQPSIILQLSVGLIIKKIGTKNPTLYKAYFFFKKIEQIILRRNRSDVSARGLHKAFLNCIDSPFKDSRFFAYIHYMEVHAPYTPPPPYDEMFLTQSQLSYATMLKPSLNIRPVKSAVAHMPDSFSTKEKKEYLMAQYDGGIRCLDSSIGELIDELKKRKILDQTLIIITADHGEEFFEHKRWGHGSRQLYDSLIHIPLIMRYPKKLPQGKKIDSIVQQVDIMPTILDLCGIPLNTNKQMQGLSLLKLMHGEDRQFKKRFAISESYMGSENNFFKAIRDQENKLLLANIGGNVELFLYNLTNDPQELVNLVDKDPKKRNRLLQQLDRFINSLPRYGKFAKSTTMDSETRERLKALGYIQ